VYEDLAQGERALRRAFERAASRIAPAGTELVSPERPSGELYDLRRGWACRVRELPDGRRVIPEIHAPGDLVGLDAAMRTRPASAVVTLEPATVRALDAQAVSRLLMLPSSAVYLAWLMSEAQLRAERRADMIARFEARERIAAMLLDLYDRLGRRELIQTTSYNLPLTQQQIGDHLGLTVVHVNRTLRQLREEKIVAVDSHVVMIRDLARLRQLASGEVGSGSEAAMVSATTFFERLSRRPLSERQGGEGDLAHKTDLAAGNRAPGAHRRTR
jgi:CRP-like cAMP-binding protein